MALFVNPTTLVLAENQPDPWLAIPRTAGEVSVIAAKYPTRRVASGTAADLAGFPAKYRKWVTDHVEEMSSGEKAAVDAAAATAAAAAIVTSFEQSLPPGVWRATVRKLATTTRTNTVTLADDPELKFPMVAGGKYEYEFVVYFDTTAAGDFKIGLNGPASPAGVRFFRFAIAPGATAFSAVGVTTVYNGGVAITGPGTTGGFAYCRGIVFNGPTAGDLALQWAQNTLDGGNTRVLEGSVLRWARIG